MGIGPHNTGLDIGSIGTHRETSDELSNSSGDDAIRIPGDRPPPESDRALAIAADPPAMVRICNDCY